MWVYSVRLVTHADDSRVSKAGFPLAELTGRVDGPSTRLVETRARQHGPCWRVMETGHPSTRVVETGLKAISGVCDCCVCVFVCLSAR